MTAAVATAPAVAAPAVTVLNRRRVELLTGVVAALGTQEFGAHLLRFMRDVANFDSAVIIAYPEHSRLAVLHDELDASDRVSFDGPYRGGLYLFSPLYLESCAGRRGFFHISEIAPEGFVDSEFYRLYYSVNDSIDQVAFLVESGNATPIAIYLERTSRLHPFSRRERQLLQGLHELAAQLVRQQRWDSTPEAAPGGDMHRHLQSVLERFGSKTLTPREREVVRLILRGYPSKSVARALDISTQTEQVHRKNIYHKLGIGSHSELFTLFFDAVALPEIRDDPLLDIIRVASPASQAVR